MANTLRFRCECGTVTGTVERATPDQGDHVVCHCVNCQAFARRFDAAERVLDAQDGTALYQSRCARVRIDSGRDRLACLHLTEKPTLRWYAACCDTPMFNTYANGKIPYVTTLLGNCEESGVAALGPPLGHLFLDDTQAETAGLKPLSMGRLMRRFLGRMIKDIFSGDRRRSAFFDGKTLKPIATPQRLS